MATDARNQMKADKALEADIMRCQTPGEIQQVLAAAVARSGIAHRDEITGRFVRTEQEAAAVVPAPEAEAAPKVYEKKGVVIAGKSFDFVAESPEELTRQIDSARAVAIQVQQANAERSVARTAEQNTIDRVEADMMLRRGEITTAEYLERTNAVENYLASQGVDVQKISGEQFQQAWGSASREFREQNPDWPGGNRNMELMALEVQAMRLSDKPSALALQQAYESLRSKRLLFDGDHDAAEMEKLAYQAKTPREIIEAWKVAQGGQDASEANENFINTFRQGRSSGIFGS